MRIGIDIDDTVAETYDFLKEEMLKRGIDLDSSKEFYFLSEDVKKFYLEKSDELSPFIPTKENAVRTINNLKHKGHNIYFITARGGYYKNPYEITYNWLKDSGFEFDDLITGAGRKDTVCEELNIDLFIDDSIDHIKEVSNKGIRTIIFTAKYNEEFSESERINNWRDLEDIL
ncbi:MAG: hypothetical protein PHD02_03955 [Bacilli bacterium]|nr:hypothetical protein [Bacilli bacterium]